MKKHVSKICELDEFVDLLTKRKRSLRQKFSFVDLQIQYASIDSDKILSCGLSLRKFRSSTSAKSRIDMNSERWVSICVWEESEFGWKYNFSFGGRVALDVCCFDLLDNFVKTTEKLRHDGKMSASIEKVWQKMLLQGPSSIAVGQAT